MESCSKNSIKDPTLLEKTIRAFSLLEALAKSECPFMFKGGSALMLQLACTQRLSVDIDIVCPPGTDVIGYLAGRLKSLDCRSRNARLLGERPSAISSLQPPCLAVLRQPLHQLLWLPCIDI